MSLYRTVILSAMLTLLASLCSCVSDEPETRGEGDGRVRLVLNIMTNNPAFENPTRADDYSFEDPINEWECVKTMRVIIVRNDAGMIVEHNTLVDVPLNADPGMPVRNQQFDVAGGETKGIWLIANEESLPESDRAILDGIAVGSEFQDSQLTGMTVSTADNRVLYDNTAETGKTYLPLCEQFTVDVTEAKSGTETTTQDATFFVTRAAVKYSFSIDPESYVDPDAKNNPGYRVSKITVTGLANKQYLMPNATVYSPEKMTPLAADEKGRIIISYKVPDDITTGPYTFTPPETFGVNGIRAAGTGDGETGGTKVTTNRTGNWTPLLYFAESPLPSGDGYEVTVDVLKDGDDEPIQFGPTLLPNLPSLPRNTHVKVNFKFNPYGLVCTVALVPYTGVWLYPSFGLDS